MTSKVTLLAILILSFVYSLNINSIKVPLSYDIVGPKSFPLLIASVLIAASSLLLLVQTADSMPGDIHAAFRLAGILLFYSVSFQFLGFMLSTVIAVYMLAKSFKTSWIASLMTGLLLAISIYGTLHFLLGLPLPMGYIFGVSGI